MTHCAVSTERAERPPQTAVPVRRIANARPALQQLSGPAEEVVEARHQHQRSKHHRAALPRLIRL